MPEVGDSPKPDNNSAQNNPLDKQLSRRAFLKKAAATTAKIGGAFAVAGGAGVGFGEVWNRLPDASNQSVQPVQPEQDIPTPDIENPITGEPIVLGEEIDASLERFYMEYTPDLHLSYITIPQENLRRFFLTGNGGITYMLEGKSTDDLLTAIENSSEGYLPEVWGPDKFIDNKYGYSAIGSVLQTNNNDPYHLVAFTHNEEHAGSDSAGTFAASISQLESFDGGKNWHQVSNEPVIKGDDPMPPGTDVSGAGQPCTIIKDGFAYVYYIDWSRKNNLHKDQIYLARGPVEANGSIGKLEFYQGNNTFGKVESNLSPVITPPDSQSQYAALPSMSFNSALNKYLCVFETDIGFQFSTSSDGIAWDNGRLIHQFGTPHSQLGAGGRFESYPTLVSFKETTDDKTGITGDLIYASGTPHNMKMRPFSIK